MNRIRHIRRLAAALGGPAGRPAGARRRRARRFRIGHGLSGVGPSVISQLAEGTPHDDNSGQDR